MPKDPIEMIKADHRKIEKLFERFNKASPRPKGKIGLQICEEVERHALLEEEVFYPALAQDENAEETVRGHLKQHAAMKELVFEIQEFDSADEGYSEKIEELKIDVERHVSEEEAHLLPYAEENLSDEKKSEIAAEMRQLSRNRQTASIK